MEEGLAGLLVRSSYVVICFKLYPYDGACFIYFRPLLLMFVMNHTVLFEC